MHKARALPKEDFRREVEKELTGKEAELSELIYFKGYKSQIPAIYDRTTAEDFMQPLAFAATELLPDAAQSGATG